MALVFSVAFLEASMATAFAGLFFFVPLIPSLHGWMDLASNTHFLLRVLIPTPSLLLQYNSLLTSDMLQIRDR